MIFFVRLLLFLLVVVVVCFVVLKVIDDLCFDISLILVMTICVFIWIWTVVSPVTILSTVVTVVRVVPARTIISVFITPLTSWSFLVVVATIICILIITMSVVILIVSRENHNI